MDQNQQQDSGAQPAGPGMSELAALAAYVRENNIKPRTIMTKSQAKRMTAQDPSGYKWRVGERYINVYSQRAK